MNTFNVYSKDQSGGETIAIKNINYYVWQGRKQGFFSALFIALIIEVIIRLIF